MLFWLVLLIMLLVVFFGGMFLSYNFVYNYQYVKNFEDVRNYYVVKNNEKLFKYYFENTTWKFNQLYGFVSSGWQINLWNYELSWFTVYFTGLIFIDDAEYWLDTSWYFDMTWNHSIGLKNTYSSWQYFFIDWLSWNFTCKSWLYLQTIWYKDFTRKYVVYSWNNLNLTLLSGDYDGWWNKNDIKFSWTFSGNENIMWKYYFDIFSWDLLYTWGLNWLDYCSGLDCVYTWYNFDIRDYTFVVKAYLTGILDVCGSLTGQADVSIDE